MSEGERDNTGLRIVLAGAFLATFVAAGIEARDFRPQAQTFPMVIVGIGVLITSLIIASELWKLRQRRNMVSSGDASDGSLSLPQWTLASPEALKALGVFGWFGLLLLLLVTVGSYLAVAVFIPFFMHRRADVGILAKVLGALVPLGIMFALQSFLGIVWPESVFL